MNETMQQGRMAPAKMIGGIVVLLILIFGGWWIYARATTVIDHDTVIAGDYQVKGGHTLVLKNKAKLTVEGNLALDGKVECDGGEMVIVVKGSAALNGELACHRTENNSVSGIRLAIGGNASFDQKFKISSTRSTQIVARDELSPDTPEKIDALYEEAARDSGAGNRIGPFVEGPENGASALPRAVEQAVGALDGKAHPSLLASLEAVLIPHAQAQAPAPPVAISGRIVVGKPPRGARQIVVFSFPNASGVKLQDFTLEGPDGNEGEGDKDASCDAKGRDGQDAMRFLAVAPNISVDNFTLKLGSGGAGGDATTQKDCYPKGTALAGKGGKSGNFKMIAAANFSIEGAFTIVPGNGGAGGEATAYGRDGAAPKEKGGDATATGGRGADNKKSFRVEGSVSGLDQIQFGGVLGGEGGTASAYPGRGGDGVGCSSDGGGGDAIARPKNGGGGGSCGPSGPGGDGGNGGNAAATKGTGGTGATKNGADGSTDKPGGNGGNGRDGCPEGAGGGPGPGEPMGQPGKPGKNLCVPPQEQHQTSPTPPTPEPTPPPTSQETRTIPVIQYNGKYLPIEQLIIESEMGCEGGQAHYHAAEGVVVATDGTAVVDPGPQCGYGKVQDKPTLEVQVP